MVKLRTAFTIGGMWLTAENSIDDDIIKDFAFKCLKGEYITKEPGKKHTKIFLSFEDVKEDIQIVDKFLLDLYSSDVGIILCSKEQSKKAGEAWGRILKLFG